MKLSGFLKACLVGASLLVLAPAHAETAQPAVGVEQQVAQVNINRADAATLAGSLRGIGLRKAEAIVAYRTEHGPFKSIDELVNVKGIGEKTLEQLRPLVSL